MLTLCPWPDPAPTLLLSSDVKSVQPDLPLLTIFPPLFAWIVLSTPGNIPFPSPAPTLLFENLEGPANKEQWGAETLASRFLKPRLVTTECLALEGGAPSWCLSSRLTAPYTGKRQERLQTRREFDGSQAAAATQGRWGGGYGGPRGTKVLPHQPGSTGWSPPGGVPELIHPVHVTFVSSVLRSSLNTTPELSSSWKLRNEA